MLWRIWTEIIFGESGDRERTTVWRKRKRQKKLNNKMRPMTDKWSVSRMLYPGCLTKKKLKGHTGDIEEEKNTYQAE